MKHGYIPVQVNNGVRRGSEEGAEVIVRYVEEIPVKTTRYHVCTYLPWFGFLLMLLSPLLIMGIAGYTYSTMVNWAIIIVEMSSIIIILKGASLYEKRESFLAKAEIEKQTAIFSRKFQ